MPTTIDITGQRFGRLTVIGFDGYSESRKVNVRMWLCECDCGSKTRVDSGGLRHGLAKSCGCYQRDRLSARVTKHGLSRSSDPVIKALYSVWTAMRGRCYRVSDSSYHNYGGRGITVCDRWSNFENFYKDMGDRPSKNHSVDRISNDGSYCPENCRWATRSEQNNNTRKNRWLEIDGERKTLAQWEAYSGVSNTTIAYRIARGWSNKDAVFTPGRRLPKKAVNNG